MSTQLDTISMVDGARQHSASWHHLVEQQHAVTSSQTGDMSTMFTGRDGWTDLAAFHDELPLSLSCAPT